MVQSKIWLVGPNCAGRFVFCVGIGTFYHIHTGTRTKLKSLNVEQNA